MRMLSLGGAGRVYLALVLLFLYCPIVVMAVMSFNESQFYTLPVKWSAKWYVALAGNERILSAAANSVGIAVLTTLIASVLGTAAALAFFRYRFRGREALQLLLFPPIAIPWLITGTAMLLFFFWIGIGRGLHAILLGHVALALPYVIIVTSARLKAYDPDLELAARSMGAPPWMVFRRVTLPFLAPGFLAAALFAFAVSFDQFVISYFLTVPGTSTLPVEIYTAIRKGFTPEINAISTIVIGFSMALLLGVARFYKFGGERK
ncbi:ABC transporter permease [Paroceanicella profunda]|uniref:ABC transporter permease n=1 Tax=Paroceanicella profunda TaxID=2579971 RepID=A0A5B8FI62_9RHOB|nr:ABC transporter permease [Paroceanicella profunda]QDL93361.1 ABC transporter permease [Paroceanicella profunda]